MPFTSTKRLYLTADDQVVEEGDERAVSLLVGEGGTVDDATAKRYKLKGGDAPEAYDAVADHEAKHGGETDAEAARKRTAMLEGVPDPDGPAVEGERDEKAKAPAQNKAVSKAPANK